MKNYFFLSLLLMSYQANFSQNVGIGINNPLAQLHIKKDLEALRIEGSSAYISFFNNAGTVPKVFMQNTGDNLFLGTSTGNINGAVKFYLNSAAKMTVLPSGQVGIGTETPGAPLHILSNNEALRLEGNAPYISFIETGGALESYIWRTNDLLNIVNLNSKITLKSNGFTGINTNNPGAPLHIKSNLEALRIEGAAPYIDFYNTSGNVPKGFIQNTNDNLYLGTSTGNGNGVVQIYLNDVPRMTVTPSGRVGINTNSPRAPLDVAGNVLFPNSYYAWHNRSSSNNGIGNCNPCTPTVSIIADNAVFAAEFDAYSDARIKNVIGISNAANDLAVVNELHIRDYTMKDKVKYGDRTFKKVIAQEVEKVYPQVVSKHTGFIPNVYQATTQVEKIAAGYLLTFINKHTISSNAKKLRILLSETETMQVADIISIPSTTQVIINDTDIKPDKIFVYGEEVDDFRTVDYEGLTTLNISATQELTRLVRKQEEINRRQNKKIAALEATIELLKARQVLKSIKD